ncbi:hypothetical protein BC938DRAFT_473790 [Jimgerdemannia flammicorona]|uniref:Protein kinase domain-containing protein n=1 Tax=Jimgerdemannia flammicorona TaxID=994334 RepID=A0A433QZP3_9FUNG|nr:hypothetical protein BC938DRAFT_473790 [Jimgerdemannia flammicorona]
MTYRCAVLPSGSGVMFTVKMEPGGGVERLKQHIRSNLALYPNLNKDAQLNLYHVDISTPTLSAFNPTNATKLHDNGLLPPPSRTRGRISVVVEFYKPIIWYHVDLPGHNPTKLRDFDGHDVDDLRNAIQNAQSRSFACAYDQLVLHVAAPESNVKTVLEGVEFNKYGSFDAIIQRYQIGEFNPIVVTLPDIQRQIEDLRRQIERLKQSSPQPVLQQRVTTPLKTTSVSIISERETRDSMDPALKSELDGHLHSGIATLVNTLFPELPNSTAIFKQCKKAKLYDHGEWPNLTNEAEFANLANSITSFVYGNNNNLSFCAHGGIRLDGVKANRKPDVVALHSDPTTFPAHWKSVYAVFELKSNVEADTHETLIQLASYVREIFGAQDIRESVIGIILCGNSMRVWQFDRAGGIGSTSINPNQHPKTFIRIIAGLSTMCTNRVGFNTAISPNRAIKIGRNTFQLGNILFHHSVVCGRGTTVYKAHTVRNPSQLFAVKISWRHHLRDCEGSMLKRVTETLGKNSRVVRHHNHEDRKTTNDIRHNLHSDDYRIQTILVMKTVGKPITKFSGKRELITVLIDALDGLRQLYEDCQIIHRDVSIYNIIIDGNNRGMLIDLDYATHTNIQQLNAANAPRTGTLPFIAIQVLQGAIHTYSHDIESLYYVFLWICCYYGKDRDVTPPHNFDTWMKGSYKDIAATKVGMMNEVCFDTHILAAFHPYFDNLKGLARELRGILFPLGIPVENASYSAVKTALEKARDVLV